MIVAGGTESMSMIPMGGNKISINPWLVEQYPESYLSMGLTAERVATHYGVTREEADEFALASHQKALAAQAAGKFGCEIVPVAVTFAAPDAKSKSAPTQVDFRADEGPRADTSLAALAKLKPAFHAKGTVTAGNSSQTSDGAAAAVVMSARARRGPGHRSRWPALSLSPTPAACPKIWAWARFTRCPRRSSMAGLTLDEIDLIELNEAFAAQALAVIKTLGSTPPK